MYLKRPRTPQRIEVSVEVDDHREGLVQRLAPWAPVMILAPVCLGLIALDVHQYVSVEGHGDHGLSWLWDNIGPQPRL